MASKLQCEICGGKLTGKPGGIFECENCGTEYSTEWAKAKIQEITGTVKVEGTVEVQGSVKVEGIANKESLLKRGNLALEDGKWDDAQRFFNEVLNADAECAEAYLGLTLADMKLPSADGIATVSSEETIDRLKENDNYTKFLQFAGPDQLDMLSHILQAAGDYIEKKKEETDNLIEALKAVRRRISPAQNLIVTKNSRTIALCSDGTVLSVGENEDGECNVADWREIMAISAGYSHTLGLRFDGTVVATGNNKYGQCDVADWHDIVAVSAGDNHTVGLRSDGTVVATGNNEYGQCDVAYWHDIVAISAGNNHTVGLRSDGWVAATGDNGYRQCEPFFASRDLSLLSVWAWDNNTIGICSDGTVVGEGYIFKHHGYYSRDAFNANDWHDIVAISTGSYAVGLRADGRVFTEQNGSYGLAAVDVSAWHDIVAVAAGDNYVVGLRADGTVVATGENTCGQCKVDDWRNIVAVSAEYYYTVGLCSDGTVVATGENRNGQCNVSDWKLFYRLDSLKQESLERRSFRQQADKETARQKTVDKLKAERESLQNTLLELKGVFSGKRRKEIEKRMTEIDAELEELK